MTATTVVFVHGFTSGPECWKPFKERLQADQEVAARGFRFLCYSYPTKAFELDPRKRIPDIEECGRGLGDFLDNEAPEGQLMLVGHSMGGLVIQSYLASKIAGLRGQDLERIRTVVMFATPNRGSTIISTVRELLSLVVDNDQAKELQVLDKEVAETNETIIRGLLDAKSVGQSCCPIPFRVFWGMQDKVVPEVSARGPFVEASPLPGGHSDILKPDPKDPRDQRYVALKNALLNPVGHPAIYEIARFEVNLTVSPNDPAKALWLRATNEPIEMHTDNVAVREVKLVFSRQNRCRVPYDQMYRSEKGWVEVLSYDGVNEAAEETMSEYLSTGRRYTYLFTPDQDKTYCMKLKIYNGFGEGQRNWHNHMKSNARYGLFRLTLNLKGYRDAGWEMVEEPTFYFHPRRILDHNLCTFREPEEMVAPVSAEGSWVKTWEVPRVEGGVVDVVWDVKQPG